MNKKLEKRLFFCILIITYIGILVFNILTPFMSDDFYYNPGQSRTLANIILKVWDNYMTWNGRLIPQFLMTWCLSLPQFVFDVLNSLCFIGLILIMYLNVYAFDHKYDIRALLSIIVCVWLFAVAPGQTLLWTAGACNYLWATVISLGYLTLFRFYLDTGVEKKIIVSITAFLFGVIAGWCNENTSGGILLLVIFSVIMKYWDGKKDIIGFIKRIPIWCYLGIIGMCIGLLGLVASPGGRIRMAENLADEEQSGIFAYVGRFLKLNEYVKDDFALLGVIIIVMVTYCYYARKNIKELAYSYALIVCSIITVYVLIFTPTPMDRALFGSGMLLIIALVRIILFIDRDNSIAVKSVIQSILVIAMIASIYIFIRDGVNLVRIDRELNERDSLVKDQIEAGNTELSLPMLRKEWDNRYTFIYLNDITEDRDGWGSTIYRTYYDVDGIVGMPRDQWDELYE